MFDPIAQYDHDDGTAIIGGFAYRGNSIKRLAGRYVFGDFARTFSNDGRLFYLNNKSRVVEFQLAGQIALGLSLLGFGQDGQGELYVLGNTTGVPFGNTGVSRKLSRLHKEKLWRYTLNYYGFVIINAILTNYKLIVIIIH